ncbi:zinc carboxypeptidase [Lutibacter oceani]|uniref:Zinc carboxypeptidase n=1 Tax=Lutibacter oceani TaxID=1853311 RepID=A0A3D9RSU7_9FLAO|nr:M14 family metallopeptidase [Lutibacter oceani]REE79785.1 zinc carboxypeptidase [Lutibacter oceani]
MKNQLFSFIALIAIFFSVQAQNIQTPSEFLGYELGSNFTKHHKVVDYFNYLSTNSLNVSIEKYGKTNEQRPLLVSFISSEENIKNLETIREDNLKRTGILKGIPNSKIGIVWLSYNVHGNEASSTEAAMLTIYKLITEKQDWLKNTIVIIDPCINPDGRDRYVNWYNQKKSSPYNTNPDATEHNEPWPGGRPNHYLFDLNRDWAWASQIETQQRLKIYNKWMPQIHVDFHEQFINNPYYFAPGAEPYHEIITDWQRDFQTKIGKNHAKYFDKNGWRYFTKESFDLLYPSYGDTYPTYMGAIGMTYEQAGHGMAGLGINTENNTVLTLKDRIAHHTTTGLSTVEMASKNTLKMVSEFSNFFDNSKLKYKNYILKGDKEKIENVIKFLKKHEIASFYADTKKLKAFDYASNSIKTIKTSINDLIIPTNQPKGKMVKVLFEQQAKLSTPITYDITAWSLPYAFGLDAFASEIAITSDKNSAIKTFNDENQLNKNAYAYINKWNEVSDAAFLGDLLEEGFNVRFSQKDFSVEGNQFKKGSLIIMRGENEHVANFDEIVVEIANRLGKKITATTTGFVDLGSDFGSANISLIKNKNIAVLSGKGTSYLSFGEIWHFFETQLNYPINVINTDNFNRINLSKYQVLILPNGYRADEQSLKKITSFVSEGGNIITIGSSVNSFADKDGFNLKKKKTKEDDTSEKSNLIPFDQREKENIKKQITGSIFKSNVDDSHPLAFGYNANYYSLKLSSTAFELLEKGYNVAYFPENTINISGYAGPDALKQVPNSLLFGIERKGRGNIIYMVDNPLFRSFWENGKLFFANAVFFN